MPTSTQTLVIAVLLSALGGLAVFLQGVREERIKRDWFNLFTELVISFVSGATAYYSAEHLRWEEPLLLLAVLVASNNGRETVTVAKEKFIAALQSIFIKKGI
ncbi:TPA: phage holin family protein [Serratia marcescens]|uniref:phage holin family protein n=1 Tax=Serratia TaxID=613 RepID=UPI0024B78D78|nr:phage holin family protein [Serratia sp. CC22-02]